MECELVVFFVGIGVSVSAGFAFMLFVVVASCFFIIISILSP